MLVRDLLIASILSLTSGAAMAGPEVTPQPQAMPTQAVQQEAPNQAVQQAAPSNAIPQAVSSQGHPGSRGGPGAVTKIPTKDIKIEVLKTADGKSGWKARIPGHRALATPAVVDGMVFVGGGFGSHEFYAFDAESG